MTGVSQLGHVHLKVRDVERAVEFYESVLGLEVTERVGRFAFLTLGAHHHDLAMQGGGVGTADPGPAAGPASGPYHAAWELEDGPALRRAYERLIERDVAVSAVDHGISKALYFDDPNGNGVERCVDTRAARDVENWTGRNERFDPSTL